MAKARFRSWLVTAFVCTSSACSLDFGAFHKTTSAHDAGPATDASADASAINDAGHQPVRDAAQSSDDAGADTHADASMSICAPATQRCHGTDLETCSTTGDAWEQTKACGAKGCNEITLDCYGCTATTTSSGTLSCVSSLAKSSGAAVAKVTTTAGKDANKGSCGGTGSPEQLVEWVAPTSDYYTLDTKGSDYDTVLYLRDCSCTGSELGCNNNIDGTTDASEVVAHFDEGQRVVAVIDGNAGDKGHGVLNANAVTCPSFDLNLAALPSTFTDKNKDGKEAFRFLPPETAFYSLEVHAADSSSTTLCAEDGPRCGGATIGCNTGAGTYGAQVIRQLTRASRSRSRSR